MDEVVAELKRKCSVTSLAPLCTNKGLVTQTLLLLHENNVVPTLIGKTKNAIESKKLREEGNKVYTSKLAGYVTYLEAVKLYTKSIASAPYPSEELALAYANRSAVLFRINKFAECVKDIQRALALNFCESIRPKLEARQMKCFNELNNSKKDVHTVENGLNHMSLTSLPTITSYNTEFPCASDAVTVVYNECYGRHVVATRAISPGEAIVIERPYSLLLDRDNIYTHCSNCLDICWANIPCEHCIYSMYCSESCKAEAWKRFHEIECAVVPLLFRYKLNKVQFFALRLVVQVLHEYNLNELQAEIDEVERCTDPRSRGFSADKKWHSDKYRTLYSLVTNTEKCPPDKLFNRSVSAAFILIFLATRTAIFGNTFDLDLPTLYERADVTFVGDLILRHIQIILSNIHSVSELHGVEQVERGLAAMPFLSLINHACNPNIFRHSRSKVTVAYALLPIKAGEQIFDCYGPHFALMCKQERQMSLEQYCFKCQCLACQEDWPLNENVKSFVHVIKNLKDVHKISTFIPKSRVETFLMGEESVLNKPETIEELCKMIQFLYAHSPQPCKELCIITETLKLAYGFNGNRFDIPKT